MFEKFTDRARKCVQLANQEAIRFNHLFVRPEHLLIGLAKEGSGVAAAALKNLGVDFRKIRESMEKRLPREGEQNPVYVGQIPRSPETQKVFDSAIKEAEKLNHNWVGTEHLLLGLLQQEGDAWEILHNFNVSLEEVREEVLNLLGYGASPQEISQENKIDLSSLAGINLNKPEIVMEVFPYELGKERPKCPVCGEGILLGRRQNHSPFLLLHDDNCCLCGQRFHYKSLGPWEEINKKFQEYHDDNDSKE